ncbi:MAG: DUF192 domain-containing protein [Candidatus Daviesbacteria bacterium]|nr:DUF192 domain-containing protein [Candidatus Daviesbacteria bacterium]
MPIYNLTRESIIAKDFKQVQKVQDLLLGLLNPRSPRTLIFKTRFGIHTFGLKTKIDVIVLDRNLKVVKMAKLKPWRVFFWNPLYNLVVEMPQGVIKNSKTELGDRIEIR